MSQQLQRTLYTLFISIAILNYEFGEAVDYSCDIAYGDDFENNCDVLNKVGFDESTTVEFYEKFFDNMPVILRNSKSTSLGLEFRELSSSNVLIEKYSSLPLKMSTANAYTGKLWKEATLKEYLIDLYSNEKDEQGIFGNETFYLFGSHFGDEWDEFLARYIGPLSNFMNFEEISSLPVTLSFGVADKFSGVPFHFHGQGFLEMLHGVKMFYLLPPNTPLHNFDPNKSTFEWVKNSLYAQDPKPYSCKLLPGDILYFPNQWLHATLNLDNYTVFITSFT